MAVSDIYAIVKRSDMTGIADAIRERTGLSKKIKPDEMPSYIQGLNKGQTINNLLNNTLEGVIYDSTCKSFAYTLGSNPELLGFSLPNCEYFYLNAFDSDCMPNLELFSLPKASYVGIQNIGKNFKFSTIYFPNAERVYFSLSYNSYITKVSLPKVSTLDEYTFYSCPNLESLDLPMLTQMSGYIFNYCSKLSKIYLPNVTLLNGGFAYCHITELSDENLPKVRSLGGTSGDSWANTGTFEYCSKLSKVHLTSPTYIGRACFENCTALTDVYFPNVTTLGWFAFCYTNITSITEDNFPKLKEVGAGFFSTPALRIISSPAIRYIDQSGLNSKPYMRLIDTPNLTTLTGTLSNHNTELSIRVPRASYISFGCSKNEGLREFVNYGCSNLASLYLYSCYNLNSVYLCPTSMNQNNLSYCSRLRSVYLGTFSLNYVNNMFLNTPLVNSSWLGQYGTLYFPSNALASFKVSAGWSSLSSLMQAIPESMESAIYPYEFYNSVCSSLTSERAERVRVVGYSAFRSMTLSVLSIPNCTYIHSYAFSSCSLLEEIYAPNCYDVNITTSFENLKRFTVKNIIGLNSNSVPNLEYLSCESCEGYLSNLSKLREVNITKLSEIGQNKFFNCSVLSKVSFGSVTSVGYYAFQNCSALESINLGPECSNIGYNAFQNCSSLSSIGNPKLTYLGERAFSGCINLSKLDLTGLSFSQRFPDACIDRTQISYINFGSVGGKDVLYNQYSVGSVSTLHTLIASCYSGMLLIKDLPKISTVDLRVASSVALMNDVYSCRFDYTRTITGSGKIRQSYLYAVSLGAVNQVFGSELETLVLSSCGQIATNAFYNCSNLSRVYLLGSVVPNLAFTAFFNTQYDGTYSYEEAPKIYVRTSMISRYQSITSWGSLLMFIEPFDDDILPPED